MNEEFTELDKALENFIEEVKTIMDLQGLRRVVLPGVTVTKKEKPGKTFYTVKKEVL